MKNIPYYHTAVVFGATGLVGKQLVLQLVRESTFSKIKVFTRRPLHYEHEKIIEYITDFNDFNEIESNLFKNDILFCCIGTTIKKAGSKENFTKVDLDLPVNIAKAGKNRGISKYIVVSSIGADAGARNFYLRIKGQMEQKVTESGLPVISFARPSMLLGDREEYRFGEEMGKVFMKTFAFAFKGKWKKYKGIEAKDVAKAMIHIAGFSLPKMIYESDELQELAKLEQEEVPGQSIGH